MAITLIRQTRIGLRTLHLGPLGLLGLATLVVAVLVAALTAGYLLAISWHPNGVVRAGTVKAWQQQLSAQQTEVAQVKQESQDQIQALTTRIARLQADMARLDAVGLRVVELVGIDEKEFGFGQPAAMGGPSAATQAFEMAPLDVLTQLDAMSSQLESKGRQLTVLESLLLDKHMGTEKLISGNPVQTGYITSHFGYRTDPFEGGSKWHSGLDFSAPAGSDILATAAGVVAEAGFHSEYGNVVDINHGDGLMTRYAHARSLLVKEGDLVRKGQVIARVGTTGRSTSPHVHYEVIRDGLFLNPARYLSDKR